MMMLCINESFYKFLIFCLFGSHSKNYQSGIIANFPIISPGHSGRVVYPWGKSGWAETNTDTKALCEMCTFHLWTHIALHPAPGILLLASLRMEISILEYYYKQNKGISFFSISSGSSVDLWKANKQNWLLWGIVLEECDIWPRHSLQWRSPEPILNICRNRSTK